MKKMIITLLCLWGTTPDVFAMNKYSTRFLSDEKSLTVYADKNDFGQILFFVNLLNNGTDIFGGSLLNMINVMVVRPLFKVSEEDVQWCIKRDANDTNPFVIDYHDEEWFTSKTVQQFFQHHGLSYAQVIITLEKKKRVIEEALLNSDNDECIICLEPLKNECSLFLITNASDAKRVSTERYFLKNCDHERLCHKGCLKKWIFESSGHNCPKCRMPAK